MKKAAWDTAGCITLNATPHEPATPGLLVVRLTTIKHLMIGKAEVIAKIKNETYS